MKFTKKSLLKFITIGLIVFLLILDIYDRASFFHFHGDEIFEFGFHNTLESKQKAYERNFRLEKYKFPREKVDKVKLFKNHFLISRLTSETVSESIKKELIMFFNNPENFDWSETTLGGADIEYTLKFYNKNGKIIGRVWLCLKDCWVIESMPFTPNIKFGTLSLQGKNKLKEFLKEILKQ